jgi:hypothetical protein
MKQRERKDEWYVCHVCKVTQSGKVKCETMDLLADSWPGAIGLAESVVEPGESLEMVAYMGSEESYRIYQAYSDRQSQAVRTWPAIKYRAMGTDATWPMDPREVPDFTDDDVIELT